jgi:hypothetical protein
VQGNAPSPARHDASIPEPLAAVTMMALQPSDRTRFKDASEAEQALREAWDRCLTQGLVHPAVLAMEEMPHDKVPARMHEPRGMPRPVAPVIPLLGTDSGEATAIDDQMLGARPLMIEAKKHHRIGDDDPTTLVVREDEQRARLEAARNAALGERPSGKSKVLAIDLKVGGSTGQPRLEDAIPTQSDDPRLGGPGSGTSAPRLSRIPVIAAAAIVAIVAVLLVLYLAGVFRH